MAVSNPVYQPCIGIDIAADTFTAAWLPAGGKPTAPLTCDQAPTGLPSRSRGTRSTIRWGADARVWTGQVQLATTGESRADMFDQGRLSTFPGLAIVIAPLAINLLDPRSRNVLEVW